MKAWLALFLVLVPVAARAQTVCPPPMPGQTHDRGVYARIQLGGTYLIAQQGDTHYAGPGLALGLAAGAILRPNLALFAMLSFHVALDAQVDAGGGSAPAGVNNVESDAFGLGLAYYLEPLNAYAAAAVTGGTVQVFDKDDNRLAGSKTGLGFQVMAGKEWWVGRDWAMGVAGEFTGAWATDSDDATVHWHAFTYSLLLSATYD